MIKDTPPLSRIVMMLLFALSCVGILIFLWLSFGGSVPLQARGYRLHIKFPEATQLVEQADVRISGVNVGKVRKKTPDPKDGLTDATLELDHQYAPIPRDTRAILRQKTLLGETYVELTPGNRRDRKLPDGGTLPQAQVAPTVELDEIFRAFDPKTRAAFSSWLDQQGRAVNGRGQAINDALGDLTPFAQDTEQVLRVLNGQQGATRTLVRDTGTVFEALTERQGQLRSLITNSNRVFETTARRNADLAATFQVFPTFLSETRTTVRRLTRFANATNPLITQLRPAARELSPTLVDLKAISPDLRGLFKDLGPLIQVSRRGLPALERVLNDTRPLLAQIDPFLRNAIPILDYVGLYKRELTAFFSLDAASAQATDQPPGSSHLIHYLRTTNPVNPESLAAYPRRLPTNRSNPYVEPGGYGKLPGGLAVFGKYLCQVGTLPRLVPSFTGNLADVINQFVYGVPTNLGAAPPCKEQAPLGRVIGQSGSYPHLEQLPPGSR